jgi:hypothetical protein
MELVPSHEPTHDTACRAPAPEDPSVGPVDRRLAQAMNASELMYFFGAPLAHVVDYEDCLRAARCDKTVREVTRSGRAARFYADVAIPPSRRGVDLSGVANDA